MTVFGLVGYSDTLALYLECVKALPLHKTSRKLMVMFHLLQFDLSRLLILSATLIEGGGLSGSCPFHASTWTPKLPRRKTLSSADICPFLRLPVLRLVIDYLPRFWQERLTLGETSPHTLRLPLIHDLHFQSDLLLASSLIPNQRRSVLFSPVMGKPRKNCSSLAGGRRSSSLLFSSSSSDSKKSIEHFGFLRV